MAKQKKTKSSFLSLPSVFNNYWKKENYILLAIGILLVIIGNYFLSIGPWDSSESLNISPIILLLAYLIIFPLAVLYTPKSKKDKI